MRLRRHSTRSCPADIPCVSFRSQSVKNPPTHPAVKNGKGRFPPEPAKTVTTQLSYRCRIFPASRAALRSCLYWPTQVLKHRREPRHSPREGCLAARIVPAITIHRLVIAITSSEARCWHAAHVQSAGAFRQSKGRDGTSACFRRKQREMRHVEKQLGYHHAGVVVWIRRGRARPIFTGSSARRRASSWRMRRAPYRVRMRLSQLQGTSLPRPRWALLRRSSPFRIPKHSIPAGS